MQKKSEGIRVGCGMFPHETIVIPPPDQVLISSLPINGTENTHRGYATTNTVLRQEGRGRKDKK
jgi:hypothetical protein